MVTVLMCVHMFVFVCWMQDVDYHRGFGDGRWASVGFDDELISPMIVFTFGWCLMLL